MHKVKLSPNIKYKSIRIKKKHEKNLILQKKMQLCAKNPQDKGNNRIFVS